MTRLYIIYNAELTVFGIHIFPTQLSCPWGCTLLHMKGSWLSPIVIMWEIYHFRCGVYSTSSPQRNSRSWAMIYSKQNLIQVWFLKELYCWWVERAAVTFHLGA